MIYGAIYAPADVKRVGKKFCLCQKLDAFLALLCGLRGNYLGNPSTFCLLLYLLREGGGEVGREKYSEYGELKVEMYKGS